MNTNNLAIKNRNSLYLLKLGLGFIKEFVFPIYSIITVCLLSFGIHCFMKQV